MSTANLNIAVRENITVLFVSCCRRTILRKFRPTQLLRWFAEYVAAFQLALHASLAQSIIAHDALRNRMRSRLLSVFELSSV